MTAPAGNVTTTNPDIGQPPPRPPRPEPKRINVAVTPELVRALQDVIDREQVSLTEAVRRLISYGDFIYRAVRHDGYDVRLYKGDEIREVILL